MPFYQCIAVDYKGKRYKNLIEASSRYEVLKKLRQLNLIPIEINEIKQKAPKKQEVASENNIFTKKTVEEDKPFWQKDINIPIGTGVSSKDLSIVAKQLSALIKTGIGLVDALELIAESIDNKRLRKELLEIAAEIREGASFTTTLKKREKIFPDFFINMVEVGEETGQLDLVLFKISEYFKRISEIKNKMKSASFYPIFVTFTATSITLGIIYFLVPTFAQIYKSLGGQLPAITQMLINISDWLQKNILYFLIGVILFIALFVVLYKKVYTFKKAIHWLLLKIPIFGPLIVKGVLAKISRTFATLFASGVPVERALELSAKVGGNVIFEEAILKVKNDVIHGEPMWLGFQKTQRFPKIFVAMVKIGEETGQLDSMLDSLADFYEDEVKTAIDGLISMIEPLMIVIIGSIVGLILIALYMPIFKMGELIHS